MKENSQHSADSSHPVKKSTRKHAKISVKDKNQDSKSNQMSNPAPFARMTEINALANEPRPIGISIDADSDEDIERLNTPLSEVEMDFPLDFYGVESGGIRTYAPASLKDEDAAFGGNHRLACQVHRRLLEGDECFCGQRRKFERQKFEKNIYFFGKRQ